MTTHCSHPARRALLAVPLLALSTLGACGGTSTSTAGPATSTTTAPAASGSASPTADASSAAPAGTAKPVPVESNPPGDIPDNLAFVAYTNRPGGYTFTHPEGWAQTGSGADVRFTDKLNGVTVSSAAGSQAPTVSSARSSIVPALRSAVPAFELKSVTAATLPAGKGVHIVFRRNSDADPVTGKVYRDEVEAYVVLSAGRLVTMDLYGPVGADNVDAYRTMSQSLRVR